MKEVFGDIKSLGASERIRLEKLAMRRSMGDEVVDSELTKRAAKICSELEQQIGLLIGRDGRVSHAVLGTKDRIYLPDLGRFRLDSARLRTLRLIVFLPPKEKEKKSSRRIEESPHVAPDLLTDLEKLRLDGLLVVQVGFDGLAKECVFVSLDPGATSKKGSKPSMSESNRSLSFQYARSVQDLEVDFPEFIEELEESFVATRSKGYKTSKDHALLVGAYTCSEQEARASMAELEELAYTASVQVLDTIIQRRKSLDPRTVMGAGKLEDIVLHALDLGADILVFDRELSPSQLRSITNLTELRVIDRSMLILDIFSQRAKSSEGRLQVELAQLKYSLPRLTERDTGLSRLTGGIGGRGPGETKLEVSRRRVRDRISELEKRIDKVSNQRGLRRERRQVRGVPVVAIVGYTNAGKSTLLNALTKGDVFVEDKLFATLDTSSRRMRFPNEKEVVFVDTVGFIRELPKELVNAFRATLEEVGEADVLLHVVDSTNPELANQVEVVRETLSSLGYGEKPELLVFNKIDLLSAIEQDTIKRRYDCHLISAVSREGLSELILQVQAKLIDSFKGRDPGGFLEVPSTVETIE